MQLRSRLQRQDFLCSRDHIKIVINIASTTFDSDYPKIFKVFDL